MPRNGSGVYTLPSGNPVVPGTTIDAAWANSTLEDMANEITNSLSRTGAGGMIAPFRIADGTNTAPGLSFLNETNSGIYRSGTGSLWVVIQGVPVAQLTGTGLTVPAGKTLTAQGNATVAGTLTAADIDATQVDFNLVGAANAVGRLKWNPTEGTLDLGLLGGNVTLQIGQEEVLRVRNATGSTLTDGQVVYITGSSGTRPNVVLAQANAEETSTKVLGVVTESIAAGAEGFVATAGLVRGLNTSAITEGAVLWLSPTTPGGITTTKPVAPNHSVLIGYCVRSHPNDGIIYVTVQNGYELDELHDVLITSPAANNMLRRNSANTLWENIAGPAGAVVGTTDTQTLTNKTISGGTVSGAVVTGLATPTNSTDAASKAYVDSVAEGLDAKASCLVATTGNITLSGAQTIDGVAVVAGNRVLVKDQTNTTENGIYVAAAGAWARSSDANTWTELISAYTFIEQGSTQINNGYICTVQAGGVLGTTPVTWSQFSAAGVINAGTGMSKTGNTLNVNTASSMRIVVGADEIDLATTGVVPSTYRSVTVDQWGRITAGTNPTTLSGYGITDAYTKTYIDTLFGTTSSAAASAAAAASSASAANSSASSASSSATAAAGSATSAAASYTTFNDQYLGSKASDPSTNNSGGALVEGNLYWNSTANEMRVYDGAAWAAAYLPASGYLALTGGTLTGSLGFSGTGLRLTGDFSNATVSSRLMLQTSTANGNTGVGVIPNGTATVGSVFAQNSSDADNGARVGITVSSSTAAVASSVVGTGTLLPMTFVVGSEVARFDTSGNFGIGTSSPAAKLDLAGDYKEGVVTANTSTAYTISLAAGTVQILTLTGNCTFTFPTVSAGKSFTLLLKQDGTGSRTATWPAAVKWPGGTAPTITSTASKLDKYVFTSDGTNWYGSNAGQNYTV